MFRKTTLLAVAALVAASALSAHPAYAQNHAPVAACVIDANNGAIQGYYSPRLKGHFQLKNFYLPQYGNFVAVRIASLQPDSPLRQIGLMAGDVVTRLDGVPIHNLGELERHAYDTGVRFIKSGSQYAQTAEVYIPYQYVSNYPSYPQLGETP